MRCETSQLLLLLLGCVTLGALNQFVPAVAAQETARKTKIAVQPAYSPLAKRLNLMGVVRIEVVIAPDGKVKKAHVLGGHPVLAAEAEKAALLTEFEAGPRETTQVLELKFGASQN